MQTRATLSLALGSLLLAGCPDPEGAYDDFNASWCGVQDNRLNNPASNYCSCATDADCGTTLSGKVCGPNGICQSGCRAPGTPDGNTCPEDIDCSSTDSSIGRCGVTCNGPGAALGEPDGLYYFTLAPPQSAHKPAPFLVTVTSSQLGAQVQLSFDIQPVNAEDRVSLVDQPFQRGPFDIDSAGAYIADWGEISIPPDTNPLTASTLMANLMLVGRFCTDQTESACGQGLGTITAPVTLNIDGTNFFMEKIDDVTGHTEPPYLACDGSQANPL